MKICTRCQKTYADDNLNFCLEDGSVLTIAPQHTMMPETIIMNDPRPTQPQPQPSTTQTPPNWQQHQQYSMQPPKKSSKTWLWVVGILGVLVLFCGGGFIGFVFWAASQSEKNADLHVSIKPSPSPGPTGKKLANSTTPGNSSNTAVSTSERKNLSSIDLQRFTNQFSAFGTTEMEGDDFIMGALTKGFYFVIIPKTDDGDDAPLDEYQTEDADTRVTVRNFKDENTRLGYGLVFHSDPRQPLQQDYAFLIDAKRKRYRVVHHKPQTEDPVKNWTASTAINGGTEENTLEVRDQPDKIDLYINGTLVTSIQNVYGYSGGVVGLYSGDGVKVAFKNLEIRR